MINKILAITAMSAALLAPGIAMAATPAIATSDVNIRTGPGTSYQRFGTVRDGDQVTVYGCVRDYNWCDIGWRGDRGWVSGEYLAYLGERYQRRAIPSVGVTIGLPVIDFNAGVYQRRHYRDRDWYRDRDRVRDRREDRRDAREDRRDDRRDVRRERRDVRQERSDVRDARQDLRQARRDGENVRGERRELRQERRELRQERRDVRRERRD